MQGHDRVHEGVVQGDHAVHSFLPLPIDPVDASHFHSLSATHALYVLHGALALSTHVSHTTTSNIKVHGRHKNAYLTRDTQRAQTQLISTVTRCRRRAHARNSGRVLEHGSIWECPHSYNRNTKQYKVHGRHQNA